MGNENPNYYAIIPAQVRYDQNLCANAKLLYGEISALSNKDGHCWASNEYFAGLYNVAKGTISTWIGQLARAGHIRLQMIYREGSKEIQHRYIRIDVYPMHEIMDTPIHEIMKDNTTDINNTSNNNIYSVTSKETRFRKPTVEEVEAYCLVRRNAIKPEQFVNYYDSKGWRIGNAGMKDWKAAVRTWEANDKKYAPAKESVYRFNPEDFADENSK